MKYLQQSVLILASLIGLALGLWLRANYDPEWLRPSADTKIVRPWAVEADCYSRMFRVKRILEGKGLIQNFHPHENYPQGLIPSTTAPLDYCILALYFPLKLFSPYPLDWAGALVSPICWVAMVLFWTFVPFKEWTLLARGLLIFGTAILPGDVWATAFGRPDHQSLILALFALAFTAEFERWKADGPWLKGWNIFAGVVWGVVIWTSLFEPLVLIFTLILFNLILRRRENLLFLVTLGSVLLVALACEGVHVFVPAAGYVKFLENASQTVAELKPLVSWHANMTQLDVFTDAYQVVTQLGAFVVLMPLVAGLLMFKKERTSADFLLVFITFLTTNLAVFENRWSPYAELAELLLLARWISIERDFLWFLSGTVVSGSALVFSLTLELDFLKQVVSQPPNQPAPEMEVLARSIDEPGAIMAPWWLSAGLGYMSDHPIVTCSSHTGIAGIVDGATFYCTASWEDADKILNKHQVRWVVVYDDHRYEYPELNSSRVILGLPIFRIDPGQEDNRYAEVAISQQLISLSFVPHRYQLRSATTHLKLYHYDPMPSEVNSSVVKPSGN